MKLKQLLEMSAQDLITAEHMIENLFKKLKLDVIFSIHFKDRVQGRESNVTRSELTQAFKKLHRQFGKRLVQAKDNRENFVGVLKDLSSELNIPFAINFNKETKDHTYILQGITIMRKNPAKFKTNASGGNELLVK